MKHEAVAASGPRASGLDGTPVSVIPRPERIEPRSGSFTIGPDFAVLVAGSDAPTRAIGEYCASRLAQARGLPVEVVTDTGARSPAGCLRLACTPSCRELGREGYRLDVAPDGVSLEACAPAGLFYGVQTVFQLLPPDIYAPLRGAVGQGVVGLGAGLEARVDTAAREASWAVPCLRIEDRPRFAYRGMHLDVGRHYFPVDFIKRYLDLLAMHKLNTFHWHLTEDQGWRLEIDAYPRLTQIGSRRRETQIRRTDRCDGRPYGGYYTKQEIREVVAYAAALHITVIPEIEMPGHSVAALAAYPELSCTGGPFSVRTRWGVAQDIYCAGNEATFAFLEQVLAEVLELFPSPYIHIGGDEAPKDRWRQCPKCQRRIAQEGLADEYELQSWFVKRIERFLLAHDRKLIGWDEILEGGLAPEATVMSWRGTIGGIAAARQGHDVIMAPYSHLYFDGYQAEPDSEPFAIGYWAPLEKVYGFEPVPAALDATQRRHVIGVQANLWTEYVATPEHVEYMLLPRLSALAELAWTPASLRRWDCFAGRLATHYRRLQALGAFYHIPTPAVEPVSIVARGDELILENPAGEGTIHFTTDGGEPNAEAPVYAKPLVIVANTTVRARTILPDGRESSEVTAMTLVQEDAPAGLAYGLRYEYYELDDLDDLHAPVGPDKLLQDLSQRSPQHAGYVNYLTVDGIPRREGPHALRFTGFIEIPRDGDYTFHLRGNDACALTIDGRVVCGADRWLHESVSGTIRLPSGLLPFEVRYLEWRGQDRLQLACEGPDVPRRRLPAGMLFTRK